MRLYDSLFERHLVVVTGRTPTERAYLVNDQISPITRNNYVEVSFTTWCNHLVIEEKENVCT